MIGLGDVVVCVIAGPHEGWPTAEKYLVEGSMYRIDGVAFDPLQRVYVSLDNVKPPPNAEDNGYWLLSRFRKVEKSTLSVQEMIRQNRPVKTDDKVPEKV